MKQRREVEGEQVPVGIIISGGSRQEETPRFSAYVWGPGPTSEEEPAGEVAIA